jgi:acyl transferase domain-containing protein/aryl carrier-like protein
MMEPAVEALTQAAARLDLRPPRIPYLSNVTGTWIRPEEATDPAYWGRHLRQTVRFVDGLQALLASDPGVLLEVGPGETLGRLARRELRRRSDTARPLVLASLPAEPQPAPLLRTLGRLWLAGALSDWRAFPNAGRRRLPLPTYPFERRRYWTEPGGQLAMAAQEEARAAGAIQDLADWFYIPSWTRSLPPPALRDGAELPPGAFLIFSDGEPADRSGGLGVALAARLRRAGRELAMVVAGDAFARFDKGSYSLRPGVAEDYEALLASLAAEGLEPAQIVHLWNAGPVGPLVGPLVDPLPLPPRLYDLEAALDRSFYGPLFLLRALARGAGSPLHLWAVACHLHDVAGGEAVAAERSALLGLFKVASLELPAVTCHTLDLAPPGLSGWGDGAVERILSEVAGAAARPAETVIAYRGRQRWTQSFAPVHLEAGGESAPRLRPKGVYLITGGLGGIGEAVARFLIGAVAARVILIGRTALPRREEWDALVSAESADGRRVRRLQRLEEVAARAGGEAVYVAGDVADRSQMEGVRELARTRWGAVHGIIHAAGVPGGGLIARQAREIAAAVLAPKIRGTLLLAELFPPRDLDFCLLCSSLAGTLGGLGQADYCAANAFQDALAGTLAASGEGGRTISVAWDTWTDAGMAVDTNAASAVLVGLDEGAGIEALRRILARVELPQVLVSVRDLDVVAAEARSLSTDSLLTEGDLLAAPDELQSRPQLATAYVAPRTPVEARLAEIWQDLLGIAPVGVYDDFFELGGDSVLSLRIIARAREQGFRLTPGQLFQDPTIAALASLADLANLAPEPEIAAAAPEPAAGSDRRADGAALTPEDVPDAEVSARDLETLLAQLSGGSPRGHS